MDVFLLYQPQGGGLVMKKSALALFFLVFIVFGCAHSSLGQEGEFCDECFSSLTSEAWSIPSGDFMLIDSDVSLSIVMLRMNDEIYSAEVYSIESKLVFRKGEIRYLVFFEGSLLGEDFQFGDFSLVELRKVDEADDMVNVAGMHVRDVKSVYDFQEKFGESAIKKMTEAFLRDLDLEEKSPSQPKNPEGTLDIESGTEV